MTMSMLQYDMMCIINIPPYTPHIKLAAFSLVTVKYSLVFGQDTPHGHPVTTCRNSASHPVWPAPTT